MPAVTAEGIPYPLGPDQQKTYPALGKQLAEAIAATLAETATVGGVWQGTATFNAGYADISIPVKAAPELKVWSPVAVAHDTHNGRVWVCTVPATGAAMVYLRVYNVRDGGFAGAQSLKIHWRATAVLSTEALLDGEPA